ncbi:MAG: efflux RND transporter permease subunit [Gammaproteobacteria bacterium]|nr:efflux RND transporter permease subunit [Gammaproteobacteria bacterium]
MKESRGNISTWCMHHPIGVVMLTLAAMMLGLLAYTRLSIDLLPHVIHPEVRVRVMDPGVPAKIMEDKVTRQLEEQLAITEGVVHIHSTTSKGRSAIDLSFDFDKDIDIALRDASNRLDRARRFLPDTIDPPIIYKRDPFQRPVMILLASSTLRSALEIREWADYTLSKLLLNLPGIAAIEVGGGVNREIQIEVDQERLAASGIDITTLTDIISNSNSDTATGRLEMRSGEISGITRGQFSSVDAFGKLTLPRSNLQVSDVATIYDANEEERIRVRSNGMPGVKVSIQKQPGENTVDVVTAVTLALGQLRNNNMIPDDISLSIVKDDSTPIKSAIDTTLQAAISGALLAMLVVYLMLGDLKRTLIIGTAIPVAMLITFLLMSIVGLSINIMTLGGLALGIGMLVDSTIVMLENIHRHQQMKSDPANAVREVAGAIFASTTTNLAAILPFMLLVSIIGLLFREMLFTISSAIVAAMVVSLTLIPALAGRLKPAKHSGFVDSATFAVSGGYSRLLQRILSLPAIIRLLLIALFVIGIAVTSRDFFELPDSLLPKMDEGSIMVILSADEGSDIDTMDKLTHRVEEIIGAQSDVDTIFTTVGGFIFGRTQVERPNRSSIQVLLKQASERSITAQEWVTEFRKQMDDAGIPGLRIRSYVRSMRGIRINQGEDDLSLQVRGANLETLTTIAEQLKEKLQTLPNLNNLRHSNEDPAREMVLQIDHEKAARYGIDASSIGQLVRTALDGRIITSFYADDRSINVRLRLKKSQWRSPGDLHNIQLLRKSEEHPAVRLADVVTILIQAAPSKIQRDRQQRIVEVSASFVDADKMQSTLREALEIAHSLDLPDGYGIIEAGSLKNLQQSHSLGMTLLALALFLVLVVMAVQYESLRNPLVILLGVPFSVIGVSIGLDMTETPISMPVWIGMIMLAGIVVNNAIVLVETIEIQRRNGMQRIDATVEAARIRLKPILMTTLTTVFGMLPLAMAHGEGSEMLQPLAVVIISGLLFSILVSLLLIPIFYVALARR